MANSWRGAAAKAMYRKAATAALGIAAEALLTESNRTVPIEEATLERSGQTSVDAQTLEAAVSYDTPYAVYQHEELGLGHDPGRRAKWLEATLDEQRRPLVELIADEIEHRTI